MTKRQHLLEVIRVDAARYGEPTRENTRRYVENRISYSAYQDACNVGYREYRKAQAAGNVCKHRQHGDLCAQCAVERRKAA